MDGPSCASITTGAFNRHFRRASGSRPRSIDSSAGILLAPSPPGRHRWPPAQRPATRASCQRLRWTSTTLRRLAFVSQLLGGGIFGQTRGSASELSDRCEYNDPRPSPGCSTTKGIAGPESRPPHRLGCAVADSASTEGGTSLRFADRSRRRRERRVRQRSVVRCSRIAAISVTRTEERFIHELTGEATIAFLDAGSRPRSKGEDLDVTAALDGRVAPFPDAFVRAADSLYGDFGAQFANIDIAARSNSRRPTYALLVCCGLDSGYCSGARDEFTAGRIRPSHESVPPEVATPSRESRPSLARLH